MRKLTVAERYHRIRDLREDRGAAQIEFALSVLLILFLMFLMWEFVMLVYTMNVLSDAAKEGVRVAIVRGTKNLGGNADWDPLPPGCPFGTDHVKCKVWDYARFSLHDISDPSRFNVTVTNPGGTTVEGYRVRVVVTYRYLPYINIPVNPTLHAAAEGRLVN
jgi:hypothetical protein